MLKSAVENILIQMLVWLKEASLQCNPLVQGLPLTTNCSIEKLVD